MDGDLDIRNQIIITEYDNDNDLLTNLELAAKYSKNKKNFKLFKKLLLKNKNIVNKLLNKTIKYVDTSSSIDIIDVLIKSGADINFQDGFGYTALLKCASFSINSINY